MSRLLIGIGILCITIGLLWPILSKMGLGRLPGDIVIERENKTFYFPLMTSLIVSLGLSLLIWLFRR